MPIIEEEYIKKIGLINMHNCYLIDFDKELIPQINYIFENKDIFDKIKLNGYQYAIENLSSIKKHEYLDKIVNFN